MKPKNFSDQSNTRAVAFGHASAALALVCEIGQVYYVDPSLPGEPMTFRDVWGAWRHGLIYGKLDNRFIMLFDSVALQ